MVSITGSAMATVAAGGMASGVCSDCQDSCRTCDLSRREHGAGGFSEKPRPHRFTEKG